MKTMIRNAVIVGTVSAIAGYSMYKQSRTPMKRSQKMAKKLVSKATNMLQ
ncbi:hypothetical protein NSA47_01180 [Irregularibacter muris]|uniref:DUF3918 domain-containing protein n=1 Tax=Irregularibacter muris TaxID=1796619 RepID=A0AAE3L341_9FIRM|nr:hypothetical protein [Irregularibacter muris]MCR1897603.1 hypothetical protein [Irregularibacter muris]